MSSHLSPPHKMHKYKGDEESPLQGNPADPGGSGAVPVYMSLADQYGIGDDMYIGIPSGGEKMIDQEYQEYVMESPSKRDIDILMFWEVGGDGDINSSWTVLTRCGRAGGTSLQLYLWWQWTIFPFKHLLFLANASSCQARKPTPRRGINSIPLRWKLCKC